LLTEHGSKLPAGGGRLLRKSLQPEGNKWLATVRQNTFTIFEPTGTGYRNPWRLDARLPHRWLPEQR
jgi:hypothetical protein